jgi:hypothetical protein
MKCWFILLHDIWLAFHYMYLKSSVSPHLRKDTCYWHHDRNYPRHAKPRVIMVLCLSLVLSSCKCLSVLYINVLDFDMNIYITKFRSNYIKKKLVNDLPWNILALPQDLLSLTMRSLLVKMMLTELLENHCLVAIMSSLYSSPIITWQDVYKFDVF